MVYLNKEEGRLLETQKGVNDLPPVVHSPRGVSRHQNVIDHEHGRARHSSWYHDVIH